MSLASVYTKLPLAIWAKILGIHPLHFCQVQVETNPHCDTIYYRHEWQTSDHISREEIARAILEAETKIENYLGYRLAPTWEIDEWRETVRAFHPSLVNLSASDIRGYRQAVRANWGYFISGGIQAKTLISNRPIGYTDTDGDLYFETATVTVVTTVTDVNEIAIYYPNKSADDAWEIRPTVVSISGGTATIVFRRELVVVEALQEDLIVPSGESNYAAADGFDNTDFLTTVDVYRKYNDPQTQVSFLWEPLATGFCETCNGTGCEACAYSAQTGCLILRGEPRHSLVAYWPASWDSAENEFTSEPFAVGRQPDIARLYYYSGWRNKRQTYLSRMDTEWERIVAYMAAAMLDRPPCDCAKGDWIKWRDDLLLTSGDEDGHGYYRDPVGILDNPFGTRRGEVYAWRKVRDLMIAKAVHV